MGPPLLMHGPGVGAPDLVGGGDRAAGADSGPSLTIALASPPSSQLALAAGTAGSTRAARKATPERSFMVQGWATRPCTLTGWPWRMPAEGRPGTLTPMISAAPSVMAISCTM